MKWYAAKNKFLLLNDIDYKFLLMSYNYEQAKVMPCKQRFSYAWRATLQDLSDKEEEDLVLLQLVGAMLNRRIAYDLNYIWATRFVVLAIGW